MDKCGYKIMFYKPSSLFGNVAKAKFIINPKCTKILSKKCLKSVEILQT